jgi:hypothetical protein
MPWLVSFGGLWMVRGVAGVHIEVYCYVGRGVRVSWEKGTRDSPGGYPLAITVLMTN